MESSGDKTQALAEAEADKKPEAKTEEKPKVAEAKPAAEQKDTKAAEKPAEKTAEKPAAKEEKKEKKKEEKKEAVKDDDEETPKKEDKPKELTAEDKAKAADKDIKVVTNEMLNKKAILKSTVAGAKKGEVINIDPNDRAIMITGETHARELLSGQVPLFLALKLIHQGVLHDREKYQKILRN